MLRIAIVSSVEIAPQLAPLMRDPRLIVPNIAPVAPAILGKHRSRTQSQHQQYCRYRPFHIVSPSSAPRGLY
jgi:hypothetical protein